MERNNLKIGKSKKRRAILDKGKQNLDIFILKRKKNNNKSTVGWRLQNASFVGTEMACLQRKKDRLRKEKFEGQNLKC